MSTCSIAGCDRFTGVHKRCWEHVGTFARGEVAPVFDLVSREWSPAEQLAFAPYPGDPCAAHAFEPREDCPGCETLFEEEHQRLRGGAW